MDLGVSIFLMGMMMTSMPASPSTPPVGIVDVPSLVGFASNSIVGIDVVGLVFTAPDIAPHNHIPGCGEGCGGPPACADETCFELIGGWVCIEDDDHECEINGSSCTITLC